MFVIYLINYKCKQFLRFFLFASFIFSKSLMAYNFGDFKNLNIIQISLNKNDF